MKWKKMINELKNSQTTFQLNHQIQKITVIANEFKVELPPELEEFYKETNGITEMIDNQIIGDLIWNIEKVVHENREIRANKSFKESYMPFECLLFIADGGNGDNFGYSIQENKIKKTDIYAWNHENDSRIWVAPNLKTFVKWWTGGKIKI